MRRMSRGHVTGGNHVEETVHATLSASIHATNHVRVESIGQPGGGLAAGEGVRQRWWGEG